MEAGRVGAGRVAWGWSWVVVMLGLGWLAWQGMGVGAADGVEVVAGDAAGEVVVVYNKAVPESLGVAEHYAARRGVAAERVVGLSLPNAEVISRADYESLLQRPLVEAMVSKGWLQLREEIRPATETAPGKVVQVVVGAKVRTLVICYGVPLRVAEDASRREVETAGMPEPLRRNEAAVDADLTVLPLLLAGQPLTGPLPNRAFGLTNASVLHPTNGYFVVGRLDGPTAGAAAGLVDRALEAERNGLLGRGYFDLRGTTDPAFVPGDRSISNAWAVATRYGFDAQLDRRAPTLPVGYPLSHVALYVGWYTQNLDGPFTREPVEFMPGAIAYHLHSFSAVTLRSTTAGWVGPLVARGVTATLGTVSEPFLDGTPDMGVVLGRLMFFGFSWGEAAVVGQKLHSWQLTVVGDPLYRPFRVNLLDRAKDLAARHEGRVDWALAQLYNRRLLLSGGGLAGIVKDLEAEPRMKFSPILQEKLADFHREAGNHLRAAELYQSGSLLKASPRQRDRLVWEAAEEWEAAGREREAYDGYRLLVAESLGVAEPILLYERLKQLASRLGLEADAARWTGELDRLRQPPK